MPDELKQDGIGNIALQDISHSTVNITQILGKSVQYQELCEQLETQEKYFTLIPKKNRDERRAVGKKIDQLKEEIKQFKQDVLQLAEQFEKIEINSERLKEAREFFENSRISKAKKILENDLEQMKTEHDYLIKARRKFEKDILPKLRNNSDEFLILALTKQTHNQEADWF